MTKIVFLDIDGVLNTTRSMKLDKVPFQSPDIHMWFRKGYDAFDSKCVKNLNKIIEQSGAKIVVSSSWRLSFMEPNMFPYLVEYIVSQGVKADIIDKTPYLGTKRGYEIEKWLDEHNDVDGFVILDDNADMGELVTSWVRTSWGKGIENKHVKQALKIMGIKDEK
jgi:hypothetical protein